MSSAHFIQSKIRKADSFIILLAKLALHVQDTVHMLPIYYQSSFILTPLMQVDANHIIFNI